MSTGSTLCLYQKQTLKSNNALYSARFCLQGCLLLCVGCRDVSQQAGVQLGVLPRRQSCAGGRTTCSVVRGAEVRWAAAFSDAWIPCKRDWEQYVSLCSSCVSSLRPPGPAHRGDLPISVPTQSFSNVSVSSNCPSNWVLVTEQSSMFWILQ